MRIVEFREQLSKFHPTLCATLEEFTIYTFIFSLNDCQVMQAILIAMLIGI